MKRNLNMKIHLNIYQPLNHFKLILRGILKSI